MENKQATKFTQKLYKHAQDTLHRDFCKNAVTGVNYMYLGSTSEARDNLFIYRNANGALNLGNPCNLYYDSPLQCENHLNIKIDTQLKYTWQKKMNYLASQTSNDTPQVKEIIVK